MNVAADRAFDQTKTIVPVEVARGVYLQNAPSLRAIKLMHLMIATAGGRMADEVQHQISLTDIRKIDGMNNHDQSSLTPLFVELRTAVLMHDDIEKKRVIVGGLLEEAQIDYHLGTDGDLHVSWWFARTFRRMAIESNHWTILDRQTVFHLGSKYSILLFQHITSLTGLEHIHSRVFSVPQLRAILGVHSDKLKRFADFNKWAIKPAIAEISQLSRFTLTVTPKKQGRTVVAIEISWTKKEDAKALKKELGGSKVGRKARRDGTAEMPTLSFPAAGSIEFSKPWNEIAKLHGNGKDKDMIAADFRNWCQSQGIPFDKAGIEKTFEGFCKRVRL